MAPAYGEVPAASPSLRRDAARDVAAARRDPGLVVLEGVHAFKHAVRFGAEVTRVVTPDRRRAAALLADLAPDVDLPSSTVELEGPAWRELVPRELPSPLLAVAVRPPVTATQVLRAVGRVVILDRPRHLGNLGAVVRVAAAAGAGGVLVVGDADPWHPTAVRAAAGLQLALPVAATAELPDPLPDPERPVVALDPGGDELEHGGLPAEALIVVGTERGGLAPELRARATVTRRLPMREAVSSLNLATAVAAALYRG